MPTDSEFLVRVGALLDEGQPDALDGLGRLVGEALVEADRGRLSSLRTWLGRLSKHGLNSSQEPVVASLRSAVDSALASLDLERAQQADAARHKTIRDSVFDHLKADGPTRPLELSARVGCDRHQVSRALRELIDAGHVELAPSQEPGDGRARWYQAADKNGLATLSQPASSRPRPVAPGIRYTLDDDGRLYVHLLAAGREIWPRLDARPIDLASAVERIGNAWLRLVTSTEIPDPWSRSPSDVPPTGGFDIAHLFACEGAPDGTLNPVGSRLALTTNSTGYWFDRSAFLEELAAFVERATQQVADIPPEGNLRDRWFSWSSDNRENVVQVLTGLSQDQVAMVQGKASTADFWGDEVIDDSLIAAARASAPLALPAIAEILQTVSPQGRYPSAALDEYTSRLWESVTLDPTDEPHEQGYELAQWLREDLGLSALDRAEPQEILATLGVHVVQLSMAPTVDAFGCWGPDRGPALFLNTSGRRARGFAGKRATLAHEIAHLLVDRQGALPMAEVLGGHAIASVEARANAFAAELLIPQSIAGFTIANAVDWRKELARLKTGYGASGQVVAWQVLNGSAYLDPGLRKQLRRIADDT